MCLIFCFSIPTSDNQQKQKITCTEDNQKMLSKLENNDVINNLSNCKQQRDDNAISTSVIWNPR